MYRDSNGSYLPGICLLCVVHTLEFSKHLVDLLFSLYPGSCNRALAVCHYMPNFGTIEMNKEKKGKKEKFLRKLPSVLLIMTCSITRARGPEGRKSVVI